MRKEWQKPVLEVLDVNMTMANITGKYFDGNFTAGQPIPPNIAQS
ncbi:paeninodin family lasso peptide [Peribacillus sp. NPDC096379]